MLPGVLLEGAAALLGTVASSGPRPEFMEWIEQWHDFYLMAGTAAVTLAGLLFVALSLHLDQLVEDSHEHLLALGRITLMSFTMILMISLIMLVPPQSARQTGVMMMALAFAGTLFTIRMTLAAKHHDEAGFTRGMMRKRILFPVVAYVLIALSGFGVMNGVPETLYFMIGGICMALGNAAGTSWELIVQVAKHKKRAARG
ncbi:MAG: hypothetical protein K8R56_04490 [Candidatus Eisenbacteria bacterium]|nr:hypothetical protein [Candidatus Eisenbacteria bacterium]